jgi:hypothetical protein
VRGRALESPKFRGIRINFSLRMGKQVPIIGNINFNTYNVAGGAIVKDELGRQGSRRVENSSEGKRKIHRIDVGGHLKCMRIFHFTLLAHRNALL